MTYAVHMQTLENYGAHDEDGKFENGNAYWKFKGGDTYLVSGVDSPADAMAFPSWLPSPSTVSASRRYRQTLRHRQNGKPSWLI